MSASVVLRIPADPAMSRVARLAAGGLASLQALDVDQIEDVKIAVSEIILALIEHGEGNDISLTFNTDPGGSDGSDGSATSPSLVVMGSTACAEFDATSPELDLCHAVLTGVSRSYSISSTGVGAEIRVVLPGEPA